MNQRFETFAFLPPLSNSQVEMQIVNCMNKGWLPHVEFAENPNTADFFWKNWPMRATRVGIGGRPEPLNAGQVVSHIESCARRHPYAYVRFSAYSPVSRSTELCFVCRTPQEGQ